MLVAGVYKVVVDPNAVLPFSLIPFLLFSCINSHWVYELPYVDLSSVAFGGENFVVAGENVGSRAFRSFKLSLFVNCIAIVHFKNSSAISEQKVFVETHFK